MKSIILIAALVLGASSAKADRWFCNMSFEADVRAKQFVFGRYEINGKGKIHCESQDGEQRDLAVRVTGKGQPVALRIAFGDVTLKTGALNFNLTVGKPEDLLGKYRMGTAQLSFGRGGALYVATHGWTGATIQVGASSVKGDSINLGYSVFRVEEDTNPQD